MGITFKTSAVAVAIALVGTTANAQMRGGRGDERREQRQAQRQEQRQERREARQEQRQEQRQAPSFPRAEQRQARPERPDRNRDGILGQIRDRIVEQRQQRPERPNFPQPAPRAERREDRIERREDRVERREDRQQFPGRPGGIVDRINERQDRINERQDRIDARQERVRPGSPVADRLERREDRLERREERLERREDRVQERIGNRAAVQAHIKQQRRQEIQYERMQRRYDIQQRRAQIQQYRQQWRQAQRLQRRIDRQHIRNSQRWLPYYNYWWVNVYRPAPLYFQIRWYVPMPDMNTLEYNQVEDIAANLEYLTSEVYQTMAYVVQSSPNQEYARRLTQVLAQLADAADNYTDAVYEGTYYEDSIYDLFHLDEMTRIASQTLSGYSQEYRVAQQMSALRYYTQELLWIYRVNM